MKPLYLYIAAGLAALTLTEAASAQTVRVADTDQTRVATVHYADLDLSSREGAKSLIRRVRQASDAVCGGAPSIANLNGQVIYDECMARTSDAAIRKLDRPLVSVIYRGSSPELAMR